MVPVRGAIARCTREGIKVKPVRGCTTLLGNVRRGNMAIAFLFLVIATPTLGEITRRVDASGTVHFSNAPRDGSQKSGGTGAAVLSPAIDPSGHTPDGPPPGCRSPAAGVLTRYPTVEIFGEPSCPWVDRAR